MRSKTLRYAFLGFAGVAASSLIGLQPTKAATYPSLLSFGVAGAHIVLVDNGPVLPSQRPRYLSNSAGSQQGRFSRTARPNDWGLYPITPTEGVVTLKSGESYQTAADADLGSRAAGATHGHGLPPQPSS
jgi:hypothetical protein